MLCGFLKIFLKICLPILSKIPSFIDGGSLQNVVCDRRFVVTNRSGTTVSFSFRVDKPFKVIHSEGVGKGKKITKKSHENTEVIVRFEVDSDYVAEMHRTKQDLVHGELVIEFDNKRSQVYPLSGTINYPSMEVSNTQIDLGVCFVGCTKESILRISNPSEELLCWNIEKDGKCPETSRSVFSFSNCEGVLDGSATGSVESDVKIFFSPKHNVDYQCSLFVTSTFGRLCLGEEPIRVVLRGTGSYDESTKSHSQ